MTSADPATPVTSVVDLAAWFAAERNLPAPPPAAAAETLSQLLIARPADPIPDGVNQALDAWYAATSATRTAVVTDRLERIHHTDPFGSQVSLWQGDITTLGADVIVNAANEQMLGCFLPGHACIDNAIHRAAGPWLRAECAALMTAQGHREPTGSAKLTKGYWLPAQWVAHTVGPIIGDGTPSPQQRDQLADCYRSCLAAAQAAGARSIAFCCISTGVFGYPIEAATEVAIATVRDWLAAQDSGMHVIFNTFSERDTRIYRAHLAGVGQ